MISWLRDSWPDLTNLHVGSLSTGQQTYRNCQQRFETVVVQSKHHWQFLYVCWPTESEPTSRQLCFLAKKKPSTPQMFCTKKWACANKETVKSRLEAWETINIIDDTSWGSEVWVWGQGNNQHWRHKLKLSAIRVQNSRVRSLPYNLVGKFFAQPLSSILFSDREDWNAHSIANCIVSRAN